MTPFDRAEEYRQVGWTGTLLLPAGQKGPPPRGFTGADGAMPTPADIAAWRAEHNGERSNIALRLPPVVVGVDVDCYDGKRGAVGTQGSAFGVPPRVSRNQVGTYRSAGLHLVEVMRRVAISGCMLFNEWR